LTIPVLLFTLFACLAGAAALVLHSRGLDETTRTLDALNRLKREGSVAVSARGLIFAFEEKLANARRAFMLQLWLGRTLFIVCLGIFSIALLNAIVSGVDLFTTILGGTSVAAALLSVSRGVPERIARQLADVIQIQTVITGCDRQISLLESDAFAALNGKLDSADHASVLEAQARIDRVVSHAVEEIERFADPGAR
jgi:hypothetical protein